MPSFAVTRATARGNSRVGTARRTISNSSAIRTILESFVSLALAVIFFRTFAIEGYMISTGSMAPSLLGYHKRVACAQCGYEFPFGVSFDESVDRPAKGESPQWAACPNCGGDGLDVREVPRNEGDQLLVHKGYYEFVPPRRWEVVVFRNPDNPIDVYVKRVVGLPGESVQVRHGDVYINGRLNRKSLDSQQATRISVYDDRYQPRDDLFWKPRWYSVAAVGSDAALSETSDSESRGENESAASEPVSDENFFEASSEENQPDRPHVTAAKWESIGSVYRLKDAQRNVVTRRNADELIEVARGNDLAAREQIRRVNYAGDEKDENVDDLNVETKSDEKKDVIPVELFDDSASDGESLIQNEPVRRTDEILNSESGGAGLAWLEYRHWIRSGGRHHTSVSLESWPGDLQRPEKYHDQLSFDAQSRELRCVGAFLPDVAKRIMLDSTDLTFRKTVYRLYEKSHVSPVTDDYGYNRALPWHESLPIHDLMIEYRLEIQGGDGVMETVMTSCHRHARLVIDVGAKQIQLFVDRQVEPVRTTELKEDWLSDPIVLTMSLFDRQVLAAIDGELLFTPYPISTDRLDADTTLRPARIGGKGLDVEVSELQLYRDIYYTSGKGHHGVHEPFQLGNDEYFMLGDNSPVSLDSRSWGTAAVRREQLLGKPLIVHLPSKPGKFRWGDHELFFRIPDIARIRYIR